jgi:hypothetical protein
MAVHPAQQTLQLNESRNGNNPSRLITGGSSFNATHG